MLVDRIKNNSKSLVQDLEMMNRKLANKPWLKTREDVCNMLLTRLTSVGEKVGIGDPCERAPGQTGREGDFHQHWCEGSQP